MKITCVFEVPDNGIDYKDYALKANLTFYNKESSVFGINDVQAKAIQYNDALEQLDRLEELMEENIDWEFVYEGGR